VDGFNGSRDVPALPPEERCVEFEVVALFVKILGYLENFLVELYRAPEQLLGLYVGMKQECRQPKLPGQVIGGIDFQLLRDERTTTPAPE
jgi:hypothetical protein